MFNRSQGFSSSQFRGKNRQPFRQSRKKKTVDIRLLVRKADDVIAQETYQPQHTFHDFSLTEQLKQNIIDQGYTVPTPIQDQAIPHLLQGKDVVGIANTGTGKTAAFLLPLLNKLHNDKTQRVLIVAPTRELAVQIQQDLKLFSKNMHIFSVLCIGGVSLHQQIQGLRRDPHFVIGTPGRLKDLKMQGKLNFAQYNNIVLDEVDRMLDMGFINDVKFIISHLPRDRQSFFFSATVSPEIQQIIQTFVHNPTQISVKSQETARNVDQDIVKTQGRPKFDVLCELLRQQHLEKVIIFGRTKWGIEKLARQLEQQGFTVVALHGNKNQNQRQRALEQFKQHKVNILLATDIASRGLDIDDVTHVINYDLPETYEDYVHRIGRTGRANKKGVALSFVE